MPPAYPVACGAGPISSVVQKVALEPACDRKDSK